MRSSSQERSGSSEPRASYPPHNPHGSQHSPRHSFSCQSCVQRCIDAGQQEAGRAYMDAHAAEWARIDGMAAFDSGGAVAASAGAGTQVGPKEER